MIELIRQSAVPASVLQSAAKGTLTLPATESIEILVFLAKHPTLGDEARLTLAGWDEGALRSVAADQSAPVEVLDYMATRQNLRPQLLPVLIENPSVPEQKLVELAQSYSHDLLEPLLASHRVRSLPSVLEALAKNHHLLPAEVAQVNTLLGRSEEAKAADGAMVVALSQEMLLHIDEEIARFMAENAAEIAEAEAQNAEFDLVDLTEDEQRELALAVAATHDEGRMSPIQKIARMSVGERIKLAMRGNREERFILIRDSAKIVCLAVLESPRLTEGEVEMYAGMKNVSDAVLRKIATKRKYIKLYPVIKNLANNPKTPLDVSLTLIKSLIPRDLRDISGNRNVPDTLRKVARKLVMEKAQKSTS